MTPSPFTAVIAAALRQRGALHTLTLRDGTTRTLRGIIDRGHRVTTAGEYGAQIESTITVLHLAHADVADPSALRGAEMVADSEVLRVYAAEPDYRGALVCRLEVA